jgi:glutamine amidotransferase
MSTIIVDYASGNLHSALKSFQRMADETGAGPVAVSADPEEVLAADRLVLPGVGAFADCRAGLAAIPGLFEAIEERAIGQGAPFLGICVGQQMMATLGREHGHDTAGFGWIPGEVVRIAPADPGLKVPHMGWNALEIAAPHPVLAGIASGDHAYFVHSYHLVPDDPTRRIATADHGGKVTAVVARDNLIGTQFHPEKSQATGLRLIANFLAWRP